MAVVQEEYTQAGVREQQILISSIVDKSVCGRLATRWKEAPFSARWCNIVWGWVVEHYLEYKTNPGKDIASHYEKWAEDNRDKATVQLVGNFLETLSSQYDQQGEAVNAEYVLDMANEHFRGIHFDKTIEQAKAAREAGKLSKAESALTGYTPPSSGGGGRADPFRDEEEIDSTFTEKNEILIKLDDGLGTFFADSLSRDSFVSFLAGEKVGKSWWLINLAFAAMLQRRRVAFFEVGDMSRNQVKKRFYTRIAAHPYRSPTGTWPLSLKIPINMVVPADPKEMPHLDYDTKVFDHALSTKGSLVACHDLFRNKMKTKRSFFQLSVYPNSSVNVAGIREEVYDMAAADWLPDVVVIDYADILAPPAGTSSMEQRDQINTSWKQMRRLSQEFHCLVLTATQANRDSYDRGLLQKKHISEDKRKIGHVTGMVGINVIAEEKAAGQTRLNWVGAREVEFGASQVVFCAGNLAIGDPAILSTFGRPKQKKKKREVET